VNVKADSRADFARLAVELVTEFHRAFGQPIRTRPTVVSQDEFNFRARLLKEESGEYAEAYEAGDIVSMAGELSDIVVIVTGTSLVFGLDLEHLVRSYKALNNWTLTDAVHSAIGPFTTLDEFGRTLAAVMVLTCEEADRHGIPLQPVLCEIHAANMTKLGDNGTVLLREDGKVLKSPNFRPPNVAPILARAGFPVE
jgi:predicted HAD superfamily Cof-like phosphohydrolase